MRSSNPERGRAPALPALAWLALLASAGALAGTNSNMPLPIAEIEQRLTQPFTLVAAQQSRAVEGDVSLRADVRFDDGAEMRLKIRRAERGADAFNNQPRYELAAYRLQKLFLDPDHYVVPPTALRPLPLSMLKPHAPQATPTFPGSSEVVSVLQYWLQNVAGPDRTYDPARFAADPAYARHAADLNALTYLIRHGDSNAGNILVSTDAANPRLYVVDSGVAFQSPVSNRGTYWREVRVPALAAATVARLREIGLDDLKRELAVVAQWERRGDTLEPVPLTESKGYNQGVRLRGSVVQMGLTNREIVEVDKRRRRLLEMVDSGKVSTF